MNVSPRFGVLLSLLGPALLVTLVSGCDGDSPQPDAALSSLADLKGGAVSAGSLTSVSAFELRYVLLEAYALDAAPRGGDLVLSEAPGGSLAARLRSGDVDAVLATGATAFELSEIEDFAVLSRISEETRKLIGQNVIASLLVTYPDVVERGGPEPREVIRMLAESAAYLDANRSAVIEALASEHGFDSDFLRWWWERHELALRQPPDETRSQLRALWEAATVLGDIDAYPAPADLAFAASEASAVESNGTLRATVSLAVLDDPSRRAALYAIEQGLVDSALLDLDITYLPQGELEAATTTKQYSIIEAGPLAIPRANAEGRELAIVAAAFLDVDGTLLFVRRAR
jgi:hypothetical protein